MKKLTVLILLSASLLSAQTFTVSGHLLGGNSSASTTASITFTLVNTGDQVCRVSGTGLVIPTTATFKPDNTGAYSGTLYRNDFIVCGTSLNTQWQYVAQVPGSAQPACVLPQVSVSSLNVDSTTCSNTVPVVAAGVGDTTYCRLDGTNCGFTGPITSTSSFNFSGNGAVGGTLGVTGTSTLANVNLGVANTLSLSTIKQVSPTTALAVADNNGVSHFFISGTAPFNNTFLSGNGSGAIFLGQLALANVADTTGKITTAGGLALQNTSQLLPATIANDATGGITTTSNGGKSLQWNNSGVLIVNPASTSSGAALTVGGTSSSTGGISVFVGASGSATETVANYPADGASAALRMQALSIRAVSAGLLTGAQNFGVTNGGIVTGASFGTGIAQGSGLKHQRFGTTCTTGASAGNTCTTAYTWTSAFADTSYTASCFGGGGVGTNPTLAISAKSASQLTVVVQTNFNVASSYATVDCVAIHD